MLHMINSSPFERSNMEDCLRFVQPGDPILFIENGVYAVQAGNRFAESIVTLAATHPVYAIKPDLDARGIFAITAGVKPIDFDGFVELVEKHKVNSWL